MDDLDSVQHWADKIKEELNRNRFLPFGPILMRIGGVDIIVIHPVTHIRVTLFRMYMHIKE